MSSQPIDVEEILPIEDPSCELRGFIVIHSTVRGPATGGIRLYPYASDEAARTDGFRLARAMTFKAAAADLPVGGGKIVLFDAPGLERDKALRSVGRTLESMNGAFLAGRDVGIPVADGAIIQSQTRYMVDESDEGVGDLNLVTALGVLAGARAALAFREVPPDAICDVECELFAPCAIGGAADTDTAKRIKASVVAGSANNILSEPEAGATLMARGITYAPDFLVNAGALVQGVRFLLKGERRSPDAILDIGMRTTQLLEKARDRDVPPETLLEAVTRERLELGSI